MISVYDKGNTNFDKNGNAVIMPISGSIHQVAAGNYDIKFVCPMDPDGKWAHLVEEAIVKAPVPAETIENAFSGLEADVYTTTTAAALRSGPNEPTTITYPAWVSGSTYSVGSKVSYNGRNYQCSQFDATSGYVMVPPPNSPWWFEIARTRPGDPALVNLKQGTELYFVSGPSDGWYYMSTVYGLEGYIKADYVSYTRHVTPAETQPREIKDQLFRIKTVNRESDQKQVTVTATHVSYDLNGVLIDNVNIVRKAPAETLAWMEQAFMIPYKGMIATNMPTSTDASYTGQISGKSGMYGLLDPDKGVVKTFGAKFTRDNWDLFVMENNHVDRGFRIRYRNNMKGVSWNSSSDKLTTRIVPVAKAEDGSDLYLDPSRWVDSPHINDYETIYMERLKVNGQVGKDDGTETGTNWTLSTLRAEMERQAQSRFDVDQCDIPEHEIVVNFEMLGDTAEFSWLKNLQRVLLYDTVIAINEEVGLSASVEVTELEWDIVKKKITALKLSNVKPYHVKNVSGFNVLANSITGDKLTDDAGDELIGSAVDKAVDEANEYTNNKAGQTLNSSKQYTEEFVGSKHGYGSFESYIKAYCDGRYARQ